MKTATATLTPRQWGTFPQLQARYPLLKDIHPRTLKRREDAGKFPRRSYLNPITPIWPLDETDEWADDPVAWAESREAD